MDAGANLERQLDDSKRFHNMIQNCVRKFQSGSSSGFESNFLRGDANMIKCRLKEVLKRKGWTRYKVGSLTPRFMRFSTDEARATEPMF